MFQGYTQETVDFMWGIRFNNERTWFMEHKEQYQKHLLEPTRALAEQTLQDFFTTDVEIKPADIISQVAKYFYLTFDDIVGRSRTKKIALARQIAMYLVRELTSMSLNDIGLVFGGKDHTTVMHAYTRIKIGRAHV